uniref:Caveolin n=1 Tax=Callorhinchus milii TaxID=7868 RepID=V9KYG6_CALMI
MMVEDYTKVEMGERGEESNAEDINVTPGKESSPAPQDIRDPHGINRHLKVSFEEVLAEPSTTHSSDKVWSWSAIGFEVCKLWSYRILSVLCAIPFSLLTGFLFALATCLHIWCVIPCVRISLMCLPPFQTMCRSSLDTVLGPLCSSAGRCLGKFQLRLART